MSDDLAPADTAPQHERGPRPLPLFLELVRRVGEDDPALAARALTGLAAFQQMPRPAVRTERPAIAAIRKARLRDCGGEGPPIVLIPSLINPPSILDLDPASSLADALTSSGRVMLLDWGSAAERLELDLGGHVESLLLPLLEEIGEPPVLVGYCLGGTLALASAGLSKVRGVTTLAAPWHFSAYGRDAPEALTRLWRQARPASETIGVLPIEVLQAAFWSLDPARVVSKFARFAEFDSGSQDARRFVMLEDWANSGEPLPLPSARELVEDLFAADFTGRGTWEVAGRPVTPPSIPSLHFTAHNDRIVPAASVAGGEQRSCPAGHVGMVVGRGASTNLHAPLREWLARLGPHR